MRTGGTKSKTSEQLDQQLENMAASVEASIGESSGRVGFCALKENTDEVLAVFQDVLINPEFRQDKIDLVKSQIKSGISRRNDEAGEILNRSFAEVVYGRDNPYAWRMDMLTRQYSSRRSDRVLQALFLSFEHYPCGQGDLSPRRCARSSKNCSTAGLSNRTLYRHFRR